jgi:hypothetical protein
MVSWFLTIEMNLVLIFRYERKLGEAKVSKSDRNHILSQRIPAGRRDEAWPPSIDPEAWDSV